jgi:hypothetical protein
MKGKRMLLCSKNKNNAAGQNKLMYLKRSKYLSNTTAAASLIDSYLLWATFIILVKKVESRSLLGTCSTVSARRKCI